MPGCGSRRLQSTFYRAAKLLIDQSGEDGALNAAGRGDLLLEDGTPMAPRLALGPSSANNGVGDVHGRRRLKQRRFLALAKPADDWIAIAEEAEQPEREASMSVARVTKITAGSTKGFQDAVQTGLARAAKTLHGITGL